MKRALVVVAALLISLLGNASADAAQRRVTLRGPDVVRSHVLNLTGTATAPHNRVRIERFNGHRWVKAAAVPVRDRKFAVKLYPRAGVKKYRAVAGQLKSGVVVVSVRPGSAVPTDACGTQPAKADGTRWTCTFNDEFDGNSLDRTKWLPQTIFSTGTALAYACYLDDPANISVSNGSLNLTLRKVASPVSCPTAPSPLPTYYTSGMVTTYHLFSQQYGRFEARFKVTDARVPGLHEAFWLWPDDRFSSPVVWPEAGEIDTIETYSMYPDLGIPYLHYGFADNGGPIPGTNTAWDCVSKRGVFNTYTLEWTASRLKILINGKTCLVNTSGDPAFQKPYIAAFTQALGNVGNVYDGRAPLPATMSVDYFRVWK